MEQIPPSDDAATTNPHRFEASEGPRILGPNDGEAVDFGFWGSVMVWRRNPVGVLPRGAPDPPADTRRPAPPSH